MLILGARARAGASCDPAVPKSYSSDRILLFFLASNARAGDVDLTFLLLKWLHSGRWTQKKTTIALFAKVGLRVSVRYFESSPIII